jgi:hypothetical protein
LESIRGLEQNCTPRAHWRDRRAPGGHASQKCRTVPAKLLAGDQASAPLRPWTSNGQ